MKNSKKKTEAPRWAGEGGRPYFVIQSRVFDWDPWDTWDSVKYETPEAALAALTARGHSPGKYYRVAVAYQQIRYKPVKV